MELLCKNSQWSKRVDFFCKKPPPQTSNRILNLDPIRSGANVGVGVMQVHEIRCRRLVQKEVVEAL